ncbi:hypothetical protein ACWDE9_17810 [Streptomyces olivaceoviridis]
MLNLLALRRIAAVYRGAYEEERLEQVLDERGRFSRLLRRLTSSTTRPWHMFPRRPALRAGRRPTPGA